MLLLYYRIILAIVHSDLLSPYQLLCSLFSLVMLTQIAVTSSKRIYDLPLHHCIQWRKQFEHLLKEWSCRTEIL